MTDEVAPDRQLDLAAWHAPETLQACTAQLGLEVSQAFTDERADAAALRRDLLPRIRDIPDESRAADAGVFRVTTQQIRRTQHCLLRGGAAATGMTSAVFESPRLSVAQVGVCLTRYDGQAGTPSYGLRLYRRNQRIVNDTFQQALELIEAVAGERQRVTRLDGGDGDTLASLARKGIAAYAERAVLLEQTTCRWRIGRGTFSPLELLTGAGHPQVQAEGVPLLRRFFDEQPRFAFVATPGREPVMELIGAALKPGEFALVKNDAARTRSILSGSNLRYSGGDAAAEFINTVSPRVTCGVYRVTAYAPPQVFWAHADYARQAAVVLMSDAMQRPFTNRPLLTDIAARTAAAAFAADGLDATVIAARVRENAAFVDV